MDFADVEEHFRISPEVDGTVSWSGESLVFTPSGRLDAGMRYTISLAGAHDAEGNLLGDTSTFSFVVQDGAQITKTTPSRGADDAGTAYVQMWFSQPMKVDETNAAFTLIDTVTGQPVGGHLTWNEASTQLWYTPDRPLAGGRTFRVVLADGARDHFDNAVTADWEFTTAATAVAAAPSVRSSTSTRSVAPPPAGPATSLAGYALNQVNAARAAYGLLARERWVRVVLITVFIEGTAMFGALAYVGADLNLRFGLGLGMVGALLAAFGAGALLFALNASWLVPKLGQAGLAAAGALLLAGGYATLALMPWLWPAAPAIACLGLGFYMLHNTLQVNATQMAPTARSRPQTRWSRRPMWPSSPRSTSVPATSPSWYAATWAP